MAGTSSIILFNDKKPDAFFLSQLYDPDTDGVYVEDNGKIIPKPGSLCIDNQSFILTTSSVSSFFPLPSSQGLFPLLINKSNEELRNKQIQSLVWESSDLTLNHINN